MLVFVLRNPSLVEFVVVEISPDCRRVGRFRVVGHRGVNRVRLTRRVGRHTLRPGTYRLVARAVPGGRRVADTKVVVVREANRGQIQAARSADTCGAAATSAREGTEQGAATSGGGSQPGNSTAKATPGEKAKLHRGALGERFARNAVQAVKAIQQVPLWLYALLGLAIVLLGAAALPLRAAPTRGAAVLARHRAALAIAGAVTLMAVMVTYALL